MQKIGISLLVLLMLVACTRPSPTPVSPLQTPTLIVSPTLTPASPLATPSPRPTPTPADRPGAVTLAALKPVAADLVAPVALAQPDDNTNRLFIVDQIGLIRIVDADGALLPTPFLDLQDRMVPLRTGYEERGLLGLAFHPDYAQNGRFYIYYSAPLRNTAPDGWNHTDQLSEFTVSANNPDRADVASERTILQIDHPQSNHNGGPIAFGPDGYLYIAVGDGGGADDDQAGHVSDWYETNSGGNGQDIEQNLLGNILRIDVNGALPYTIPPDNPFVGATPGLDEIWAYGLRNPAGMAFDPGGTHQLFVGDAGQNLWEEIDIISTGGNYGWNVKEGKHCFSTENPNQSLAYCPDSDFNGTPLIDPILELPNSEQPTGLGSTIIGGRVYRGTLLQGWNGVYLFGMWSGTGPQSFGALFMALPPGTGTIPEWTYTSLRIADRANGELGEYLRGFGQDLKGEVYLLTSTQSGPSGQSGKVYLLTPPIP